MALEFEWHDRKAASNLRKHRISFEEAVTVFGDPLSLTIPDDQYSNPQEERSVTIGTSIRNRLLVVIHLEEGSRIRIISARLATSHERKDYENA